MELSSEIGEALVGEVQDDGTAKKLLRSWKYEQGKLIGDAVDEGGRALDPAPSEIETEEDAAMKVDDQNEATETSAAQTEGNETMTAATAKKTPAKKSAAANKPAKAAAGKTTAAKPAKAAAAAPAANKRSAAADKSATRNTARAAKPAAKEALVMKNDHDQFAYDMGLRPGTHLFKLGARLHKDLGTPVAIGKICKDLYGENAAEHRGKLRLVINGFKNNLEKGKVKGFKFTHKKEEDGETYLTLKK